MNALLRLMPNKLCLIMVVLHLFSLSGFSQKNKRNLFVPKICFEQTTIDLGRFPNTLNPKIVFKFENCGKKVVLINGCDVSCGCTMAQYPQKPIMPASKDSIIVIYNSEDKYGAFQKTIEVKNNTQDSVIKLTIKGEVTRGLDYFPLKNNQNKF